jgi:hypothetical protein
MRGPNVGEKPEYRRAREDTSKHKEETNRYENIISTIIGIRTVIDSVADTHRVRYDQTNTHETARKKREYGTIAALVLAAAVAAWGIIQSHRDTQKALHDARTASDQQHADTIAAIGRTDSQIAALQGQTGVMQGQLAEMKVEQRPWVFASQINLAAPISRDVNGIRVSLAIIFTNSGHLPAIDVHVNLSAFASQPGNIAWFNGIEREACNQTGNHIGIPVFPGFTTPNASGWITYINNEDIIKATKELPDNFKKITPLVIPCLVYKDPSGADHHTPYLLDLIAVKNGQACCVVPTDSDELAKSQIIIRQMLIGGMPPD